MSFKTQSKNANCKTLLVIISIAVPARDLQIRGEGGGGEVGHPDHEILRGGLRKIEVRPFGPQFGLIIKEGAGGRGTGPLVPSPGSATGTVFP